MGNKRGKREGREIGTYGRRARRRRENKKGGKQKKGRKLTTNLISEKEKKVIRQRSSLNDTPERPATEECQTANRSRCSCFVSQTTTPSQRRLKHKWSSKWSLRPRIPHKTPDRSHLYRSNTSGEIQLRNSWFWGVC